MHIQLQRHRLVGRGDMHRSVLVGGNEEHHLIGTRMKACVLNDDRRITVQLTGFESSLRDVLYIEERQRIHYAAHQVVGTEHNHLIVHILIACVHAEALH